MSNTKLIRALGTKKHSGELLGRLFDFGMEQPVSAFVDVDALLAQLDRSLDERLTERWVREHLGPAIDRERARAEDREDLVGDWLSEEMKNAIRETLSRPLALNPAFVTEAVQEGSVKHMLKSVVEETLDRFLATMRPSGSGGGLLGSVGRGALGFASRAGKGILGQIGGQVEEQLRGAVGGFVETSATVMLDRLVAIITSDEMARHLSETGLSAFDKLMNQPTARVHDVIDHRAPIHELLEHLPGQITLILRTSSFREGLREEVEAALEIEGDSPLRTLLADDEHVAAMRAEFVTTGTPLLRQFSKTESFRSWLPSDS
jgi:hypothetical protein